MSDYKDDNNWLMLGDCLERMKEIPDGSVDMVLSDLPYGTTQNKWDSLIPLDMFWEQVWRVSKQTAAIVLHSAQPFTSILVCSQVEHFKYDWTWRKEKGTGHLNAKKMPMRDKEDICVFYKSQCTYNPQYGVGTPYSAAKGCNPKKQTSSYGSYKPIASDNDGKRYPKQVLEFVSVGRGCVHPTQKPLDLAEYLIKTYSNDEDTVLDCTMGSGTTGVACNNLNRKFIGIELDPTYYDVAKGRILCVKGA